MMDYWNYNEVNQIVNNTDNLESNCFSIEFYNAGVSTVILNDLIEIPAGQSKEISMKFPNIKNNTLYNIRFNSTNPAQNKCIVTRGYMVFKGTLTV